MLIIGLFHSKIYQSASELVALSISATIRSHSSTSTPDQTNQVSRTCQASHALIDGQAQDQFFVCKAPTALVDIALGYCAVVHRKISKVQGTVHDGKLARLTST
jgi:hypothetical protein